MRVDLGECYLRMRIGKTWSMFNISHPMRDHGDEHNHHSKDLPNDMLRLLGSMCAALPDRGC